MVKKKTTRKKKRFSFKLFLYFIMFQLIFTAVTAPLIIFHGPFNNVKKNIVGAAMTTMSHQYIAKLFLSDEEIKKILQGDTVPASAAQDSNTLLKFVNNHDSSIERYDVSDGRKFKGYMLIIHDPTRVKVGVSKKIGVEGETTSQIANDNNAVAAINAGGFTDESSSGTKFAGTGGKPEGLIMTNGVVKFNNIGNNNQKNNTMAITNKGVLLVGKYSLNQLKKLGVSEAITFGPPIVVNGQGVITGDGGWGIAPRTAIGQRKDGAILLLVIDGRQTKSLGSSLKDVENIMLQYGAVNATNLDGGSSSTMYYQGEVISNPCDPLGERAIPTAIYVES